MGPFHILLDEMGLDEMGLDEWDQTKWEYTKFPMQPDSCSLAGQALTWEESLACETCESLARETKTQSLVHCHIGPVLTQLELGWVISAFIATAFTMLHMSLYMVFIEHASQDSRSVFSVAVCKIQASKCYTESSQGEVQCT